MNVRTVAHGITYTDIVSGLEMLGVGRGERIFVHSSLSAFGHVDGGADAVCDSLLSCVGDKGTVAMPTFRPFPDADADGVVFDIKRDSCNTGIIPELFRNRPGALRSEHICHSVAAIGPCSEDIMGDGIHPFGPDSSLYRMYEMDFLCILLGCRFYASCTALHIVEEVAQVSYRHYCTFDDCFIIRADGVKVPCRSKKYIPRRYFKNDYTRMESTYSRAGLMRATRIGNACVLGIRMRDIVDLGVQLIRNDEGLFLSRASRYYLKWWNRSYSHGWDSKNRDAL